MLSRRTERRAGVAESGAALAFLVSGVFVLSVCVVGLVFGLLYPSEAAAWRVTTAGNGWAVRIEREVDDTATAAVYLYGSNSQPTAAQLATSWDTTGASAWMGSTLRAKIGFDTTDDAFEWYSSTVSPSLIYVLAVIEDSSGFREQEVVTLGAWNVMPVYLAEKPTQALQPAARTTSVTVVGTAAVDIHSIASSMSVDGTLPVDVVSAFGGAVDRTGLMFLALGACFVAGSASVGQWRRSHGVG